MARKKRRSVSYKDLGYNNGYKRDYRRSLYDNYKADSTRFNYASYYDDTHHRRSPWDYTSRSDQTGFVRRRKRSVVANHLLKKIGARLPWPVKLVRRCLRAKNARRHQYFRSVSRGTGGSGTTRRIHRCQE